MRKLVRGKCTCKGTEMWKQHIGSGKPQVVWDGRNIGCLRERAVVETVGMDRVKS